MSKRKRSESSAKPRPNKPSSVADIDFSGNWWPDALKAAVESGEEGVSEAAKKGKRR